jgi:large exoprotein involved in heme utilization and adhesion
VNASDSVSVSGVSPSGEFISNLLTETSGTGNAGDLSITTKKLSIQQGKVSTATLSGEGGNIDLQVEDLVLLADNGVISTTAGGVGNGGNVTINTPFLILNDNSNILANAFEGSGGNINITATSIFQSPDSLITASSEQGIDGTVQLNTPDVDPSRGVIILPETVVDVSGLVTQHCGSTVAQNDRQSEFTIAGRGGLPQRAGDPLTSTADLVDWITLKPDIEQPTSVPIPTQQSRNISEKAIIEATGVTVAANGTVTFTADAANPSPQPHPQSFAKCQGL